MSGSESEALSAIVVGSPKSVNEAITLSEDTKLCSSCRHDKAISHFIGSSSRHKGQEMRTCAECRIKNTRVPVRRYKKRMPVAKKSAPENTNAEVGFGDFLYFVVGFVVGGSYACFKLSLVA